MSENNINFVVYSLMNSSSSSDEDEDMLFLKQTRKRRHNLFVMRDEEGAFNILINRHLKDNDTKFKEYFRMTPHLFNEVLLEIEGDLKKNPSIRYKNPISPKLKLCLAVR